MRYESVSPMLSYRILCVKETHYSSSTQLDTEGYVPKMLGESDYHDRARPYGQLLIRAQENDQQPGERMRHCCDPLRPRRVPAHRGRHIVARGGTRLLLHRRRARDRGCFFKRWQKSQVPQITGRNWLPSDPPRSRSGDLCLEPLGPSVRDSHHPRVPALGVLPVRHHYYRRQSRQAHPLHPHARAPHVVRGHSVHRALQHPGVRRLGLVLQV